MSGGRLWAGLLTLLLTLLTLPGSARAEAPRWKVELQRQDEQGLMDIGLGPWRGTVLQTAPKPWRDQMGNWVLSELSGCRPPQCHVGTPRLARALQLLDGEGRTLARCDAQQGFVCRLEPPKPGARGAELRLNDEVPYRIDGELRLPGGERVMIEGDEIPQQHPGTRILTWTLRAGSLKGPVLAGTELASLRIDRGVQATPRFKAWIEESAAEAEGSAERRELLARSLMLLIKLSKPD